ncbi:hypothetical protein PROFUN_15913 [Planoprotostelium fungivorum]|uniref:Uncharacterized protein n=1 Tax=Planoprotostelium fungivorum TaxID=1890364 RepID=A0A2P6MSY2_9EUKA|nr:hypothetical protein PROFUN_15913 [Planoprotostelium fungivorum]
MADTIMVLLEKELCKWKHRYSVDHSPNRAKQEIMQKIYIAQNNGVFNTVSDSLEQIFDGTNSKTKNCNGTSDDGSWCVVVGKKHNRCNSTANGDNVPGMR